MRQLRERFDDHLSYDRLALAHKRAAKGKGMRCEVLAFEANLVGNLMNILRVLQSGSYQPSNYWKFWVHDPKDRLILALPYPDRIVHQWYIEEFIKPYYLKRFIVDSYACIPGRGTHRAADQAQRYMRRMYQQTDGHYYILKMDISKFFNSIDLRVLYDILRKVIADPKLLDLTHTILFEDGKHDGLPIGNYVSQYFANIYLNELDQFCKRQLHIEYYIRYMDDFVALAPNRKTARNWYDQIGEFAASCLHLQLNRKSSYYPCSRGLDFVGYRIYNDFRLLRKRSKHKLDDIIRDYQNGLNDQELFTQRVNAWAGHASHADAGRFIQAKLGQYREILPVVFGWDGLIKNL